MRIAIVILLLTTAVGLFLLSRRPRFHAALGVFDKIGSVMAFLIAIILLILPAETTSVQTPTSTGPILQSTPTPVSSPSQITTPSPSVRPSPSPSPSVLDETVIVDESDTKWIFGNEISISVNDVEYQKASVTISVAGAQTQTIKEKGVGYVIIIKGRRTYRVTIAKIENVGSRVTFRVTLSN